MAARSWTLPCVVVFTLLLARCVTASPVPPTSPGSDKAQITILYDAFGKSSDMQEDWGYAALIEYGGKRILFDAGNNPDILARNAKARGVISRSLISS